MFVISERLENTEKITPQFVSVILDFFLEQTYRIQDGWLLSLFLCVSFSALKIVKSHLDTPTKLKVTFTPSSNSKTVLNQVGTEFRGKIVVFPQTKINPTVILYSIQNLN